MISRHFAKAASKILPNRSKQFFFEGLSEKVNQELADSQRRRLDIGEVLNAAQDRLLNREDEL